jgi:hypothetical protein
MAGGRLPCTAVLFALVVIAVVAVPGFAARGASGRAGAGLTGAEQMPRDYAREMLRLEREGWARVDRTRNLD